MFFLIQVYHAKILVDHLKKKNPVILEQLQTLGWASGASEFLSYDCNLEMPKHKKTAFESHHNIPVKYSWGNEG